MAIQVKSQTNTVSGATVNSIDATKPSGLAVGDLMVAVLIGYEAASGANRTFSKSGWTSYASQDLNQSGSAICSTVLFKVADDTDVAASTFTFNCDSTCGKITATMLRVSGAKTTGPNAIGHVTGNGGNTPPFAETITPNANSLLIYVIVVYHNGGNSVSGYSIVTSNPSWTELFNISVAASFTHCLAIAYALRPQSTATGNASATITDEPNGVGSVLFAIPPAVLAAVSDTQGVTEKVNKAIQKTIKDTSGVTEEVTASKKKQWDETTKPAKSWDNTPK